MEVDIDSRLTPTDDGDMGVPFWTMNDDGNWSWSQKNVRLKFFFSFVVNVETEKKTKLKLKRRINVMKSNENVFAFRSIRKTSVASVN